MHKTILLLGTNLGNKKQNLLKAQTEIKNQVGNIAKYSDIYITEAWGNENQDSFLNQVLIIHTQQDEMTLLKTLQNIEKKLGRDRSKEEKWGSRIIDIDILFYDNIIYEAEKLTIPHPYIHLRKFTLLPLAQIAPEYKHPKLNKTIKELKNKCTDTLKVIQYNEEY